MISTTYGVEKARYVLSAMLQSNIRFRQQPQSRVLSIGYEPCKDRYEKFTQSLQAMRQNKHVAIQWLTPYSVNFTTCWCEV